MFVLGFDPGLTRCGFGLATRSGSTKVPFRVLLAGVLETDPADSIETRLASLALDVEELLDEVRPDEVAVEKIFFQTNVRTAISVAQASGLVLAAAGRRSLPVSHYTPNEVKQAVVGHGGATKEQVQQMVARLCGLPAPPSPPDAADAIALAACHLTTMRLTAAASRSGAGS
jgi:crossover junction endodeoxyribonuclease RuvC